MISADSQVITPVATRSLTRALIAIFAVTWMGDFLFWRSQPGLSVGVFGGALGLTLCATGKRSLTAYLSLILLLASCVQSAVELSLSNYVAISGFLIVILGETAFSQLQDRWLRWTEAIWSLCTGPIRWAGLASVCAESKAEFGGRGFGAGLTSWRILNAVFPALLLTAIFTGLLASGNAVLGEVLSRIATRLFNWLLDFSIARTALWIVWATIGLSYFWPAIDQGGSRWWQLPFCRWERRDKTMARWQSGLILVAVNAVFFMANTTDAIYLWANAALPSGVNYSHFVHEGVQALILAVLLAAAVLTAVFQQDETVSGVRSIKAPALVWILQNLLLMWSVAVRLRLYVEAYQLSELRVYVGCFLGLVALGFLQLGWQVVKGLELRQLLIGNVISAFALFFLLQFCDVGTWVADWNLKRWDHGNGRPLDLAYLASLGPSGWPALIEVASEGTTTRLNSEAKGYLQNVATLTTDVAATDWRAMQVRRDRRLRAVKRLALSSGN